ncbi:MAG: glycoside hydrolase, partial [Kiritimatiellae bacterium]|nr:glycoside hydrolase [Kiritimatiellia bacterium]
MFQDKLFCRLAFALLIAMDLTAGVTPVWPEATRDSKPWVYNWWMGSAVDEDGLEAQCVALAEKGFGGFHVIPIYGAKGYESKYRKYLSDEWMSAFADAVRIGAKHGLGVDLTTGSGWCFGGPQIDASNGCWRLKKRLDGKAPYVEPVPTGQLVKRAGPGGEGLMMDPYSVEAMDAFLRSFSASFDKDEAARPVRMYHDSFEYYGAGWTPRFFELFKKKRGYDLKDHWESFASGKGNPEIVARLKCDYRETLSDLIVEDVFPKWTQWCRSRGIETRNEAHGSPANWLDFYALADCPETEMFGKDCQDILISKFASSTAHVCERKYVSAEACTWVNEHFCETPLDYKRRIDRLLLSGVNRIYYHGFCYSPTNAVWPGWSFYASSQTNPRNPLWRDFDEINAYVTRIQSLMQSTESDCDILVYWPIYDWWTDPNGFERLMSVHDTRWFDSLPFGRISRLFHENGFQFDYVSDRQLEKLHFGNSYRTIVVPSARVM